MFILYFLCYKLLYEFFLLYKMVSVSCRITLHNEAQAVIYHNFGATAWRIWNAADDDDESAWDTIIIYHKLCAKSIATTSFLHSKSTGRLPMYSWLPINRKQLDRVAA